MRTLDELLKVAREAEAAYKARVASAEKEYQQELLLVDQAKAEAQAALSAGDEESYTKAQHDEQYHKQRASELYKQTTAPYFTEKEHNDLVAEIRKAEAVERRVLFKRLYELRTEMGQISKALEANKGKCDAAGYALCRAGMPSSGNYQHMFASGTPSSIASFLRNNQVVYDIKLWYNPKKEAAPNA